MDAQIQRVVDKMAEIANLKVDNWQDGSHLDMEWTSKQEKEFINWLVDELGMNKALRKVMMTFPTTKKSVRISVANAFDSIYGFKTSDSNAI